jgi:hypothetical protein
VNRSGVKGVRTISSLRSKRGQNDFFSGVKGVRTRVKGVKSKRGQRVKGVRTISSPGSKRGLTRMARPEGVTIDI